MSQAMSISQLNELLEYIYKNHSPFSKTALNSGKPTIKYVDPVIDMRTGTCFTVIFRGFSMEDKTFTTVNESRDLPDSLYDRIMTWLKER